MTQKFPIVPRMMEYNTVRRECHIILGQYIVSRQRYDASDKQKMAKLFRS